MRQQWGPEPPALAGLLAELTLRPYSVPAQLVLADLLEELSAGEVTKREIPDWLRLSWIRRAPGEERVNYAILRSEEISYEIKYFLDRGFGGPHDPDWENRGQTWVAGRLCFVIDPVLDPGAALDYLLPLGLLLGLPVAYSRRVFRERGKPFSSVSRILLFPPSDGKPVPRHRSASKTPRRTESPSRHGRPAAALPEP